MGNAEERILAVLVPDNMTPSWGGALTSFEIAEITGLHINTVRRTLRRLNIAGRVCAYSPRKWDRGDGYTGRTWVWYSGQHEPWRRSGLASPA